MSIAVVDINSNSNRDSNEHLDLYGGSTIGTTSTRSSRRIRSTLVLLVLVVRVLARLVFLVVVAVVIAAIVIMRNRESHLCLVGRKGCHWPRWGFLFIGWIIKVSQHPSSGFRLRFCSPPSLWDRARG